jgi:phosphocarrier protein
MSETKVNGTVIVANPWGLHARPADLIARLANRFTANITIAKGYERIDAKSMLGIMTLGAPQGTELAIEAEGADAREAVDALVELIGSPMDEISH